MPFKYTISLGRELQSKKIIRVIYFSISRYGKHQERLEFPEPVSEQNAVAAVEAWLSVPLDAEHYQRVADDLFPGIESHEQAFAAYETRGDCLGDCSFLELIDRIGAGQYKIECGS